MKEHTVLCPLCRMEVGRRDDGRLREHGRGRRCAASGQTAPTIKQHNTSARLGAADLSSPRMIPECFHRA